MFSAFNPGVAAIDLLLSMLLLLLIAVLEMVVVVKMR